MTSTGPRSNLAQLERSTFKKTDFRHQLWVKERKALRQKAKRNSFRVDAGKPSKGRGGVSVDTSKARSTVDVLRMCLKDLGWREYPLGRRDGGSCDIHWHSVNFSENPDHISGRVNKFPGMIEVVRKVNLGRALDTLQCLYPQEYNFHPQSWFLPQQYADFCDAVRRAQDKKRKPVYIVKPDEGSQGDGIYLIHEPRDYMFSEKKHIVQTYIANPMLLEGLKFDFRVYVVIASLDPLEVYICKEGLARFCTVPYESPTNRNIHESYMHLTNYSLNKKSSGYLHTESEGDGSKRTMTSVFKTLQHKGYDTERIWAQIEMLVAKTMIAVTPELKVEYKAELSRGGPSCFQILGFDILLTDDCTPMLLEVNANPSLRIDFEQEVAPGIYEHVHSPVDEEIKRPLVMDTLILAAPRHKSLHRVRTRRHRHLPTRSQSSHMLPQRSLEAARKALKESLSDNESLESSSEAEEEDLILRPKPHTGYGTLTQIYPRKYGTDFEWLRVLDRAAEIFMECLGVRGSLKMGSTGFRTFTRKCKLTANGAGFTNATLDIMFIDLQRRWEHTNQDKAGNGLCFQGFVEAFFQLAKKRFAGDTTLDAIEKLLDHSEANLSAGEPKAPLFPQINKTDKKLEEMRLTYGNPTRKKLGNSYFMDYRNYPVETRKGKTGTGKGKMDRKKTAKAGSAGEDSAE